jgi:hypothetical protein
MTGKSRSTGESPDGVKMQGRKAKAANAGNQGGKIADLDKTRSIA